VPVGSLKVFIKPPYFHASETINLYGLYTTRLPPLCQWKKISKLLYLTRNTVISDFLQAECFIISLESIKLFAQGYRTKVKMTPEDERKALESIIWDFEMHYKNGPDMFASRSAFDSFVEREVRFHAKLLKIEFEKAKETLIAWIEQNHTMEYIRLT
jgi:hypothetical protein